MLYTRKGSKRTVPFKLLPILSMAIKWAVEVIMSEKLSTTPFKKKKKNHLLTTALHQIQMVNHYHPIGTAQSRPYPKIKQVLANHRYHSI